MHNTTKTDDDVLRTRDHAEMIQRPHLWTWQTLPLEHKTKRDACGLLLAAYIRADNLTRIYLGNVFLASALDPSIDYISADAIVADGWVVD